MAELALVANPDIPQQLDDERRILFDQYRRSKDQWVTELRREKWNEFYDLYRMVSESDYDTADPIYSDLVHPMIHYSVQSIEPKLMQNKPRVEVTPRGEEDLARVASHRALQTYWWDALRMPLRWGHFSKYSLIYGTAWHKGCWHREFRDRIVRQKQRTGLFANGVLLPDSFENQVTKTKQRVEIYNAPKVQLWDIDKVFPDDGASEVQDCEYIIFEGVTDLAFLENAVGMDGEPLYRQSAVAKLKKRIMGANPKEEDDATSLESHRKRNYGAENQPMKDPYLRQLTLLEKNTHGKVVTCIKEFEDFEPVGLWDNPYGRILAQKSSPVPLPNEMYGMGVPEVMYSVGLEATTLHNITIDNLIGSMHQMVSILDGRGLNPDDLRWRPFGWVMVEDHDDFQYRPAPEIKGSSYRERSENRFLGQLASGSTDILQGVETGLSGGTATTGSLVFQNSLSRIGTMFQYQSLEALNPLGQDFISLAEVHVDDSYPIPLADASGAVDLSEQENQALAQFGAQPQNGFLAVQPEVLLSGTGVDLDVRYDVSASEPATKDFLLQQATATVQSLGPFLTMDHPIMERALKNIALALGETRPDVLVQMGRSVIEKQQQLAAQAGGPTPTREGQSGVTRQASQSPSGGNANSLAQRLSASGGQNQPAGRG